jgi:hypothetical protein
MGRERVNRMVTGLIAMVIGALMLAEGVLGWVTGTSVFYEGVNPSFKFAVGLITIVSSAHLLEAANGN